ncbi:histidine phosphatase family protein [Acidovorax sp. RAC01]|uniref:histidine phosphatase family protein n=1 Tax=Acidovorax sp. RAC01 TaxID=1842533 RepID=UPI000858B408|nr:histidine phosphatase family protein [Acidovorax sp. RAC01]AOG21418.1 histidine phosphatase super family protein [Acidovorax sp. RAC01]
MPSNPWPDGCATGRCAACATPALPRRALLAGAAAGAGLALLPRQARAAIEAPEVAALLRQGGVVIAFRHALAPGTFDPPGFRLGDCSTQRNLSEEGRAQARRIGEWFRQQGLAPARVASSPWCRCLDTARLAFGQAPENWAALGSPRGYTETTGAAHLEVLRKSLTAASARPARFEVWVTHMFVLADLAGANAASGEGLVLRMGSQGNVETLARLAIPA